MGDLGAGLLVERHSIFVTLLDVIHLAFESMSHTTTFFFDDVD